MLKQLTKLNDSNRVHYIDNWMKSNPTSTTECQVLWIPNWYFFPDDWKAPDIQVHLTQQMS